MSTTKHMIQKSGFDKHIKKNNLVIQHVGLFIYLFFFSHFFHFLHFLSCCKMGVNSSKFQKKNKLQIIDFGSIIPLGLYEKNNDDYDLQVVRELILSKKLSPFYKGKDRHIFCGELYIY